MYRYLYGFSCFVIMLLVIAGGMFFSGVYGKYAATIYLIVILPAYMFWVMPFLAKYFVRKQKEREILKGEFYD